MEAMRTEAVEAGVIDLRAGAMDEVGIDALLRLAALEVDPPSGTYVRFVKPAIDRTVALVVVLMTLPVMGACALAIRLTMGKGVLFKQQRVGLNGAAFTVYKFRTMLDDRRMNQIRLVGEDRRYTHKHPGDPRVTAAGRFLRKWSLDELPQLFNVLKGDMSLVGPRPELPFIVSRYGELDHCRHFVRPGLTGLWQVSARGSDEPMCKFVQVDLDYVRRVSPALDAMILVKTPLAVLGLRRGF